MKRRTKLLSVVIATIMIAGWHIATAQSRAPISIVEHIRAGRLHTVVISDSVMALLAPAPKGATPDNESASQENQEEAAPKVINGKMVGYRVQVFSDNNPRTSKNEAKSKQRSVSERFPAWRTYITFNSPYWRLKVGDFRTQNEANEAAEELRRAFPGNAKEIRVVRDRINVSN